MIINVFLFFENFSIGLRNNADPFLSISPIFAKKTIFIGMPIKATIIVNIFPVSEVGVKFP